MIEQCIYTRSSADRINSRGQAVKTGFGYIAKSDGLSNEDLKKLEVFASDYDTSVSDRAGKPVASVMKYRIESRSPSVVLSKSSRISQSERKAHICHQVVFTAESADFLVRNPEMMFKLGFADRDVDGEDVVLDSSDDICSLLAPADAEETVINKNLADTLGYFNLSPEKFRLLLSAVFDCRMLNRKIIVLTDYLKEDAFLRSASLLYHIFRFLPYRIRAEVGFDTCYSRNSEKSVIDICFASETSVKKISPALYKIGEKNCMYDYVVDSGEIIHTKADSQQEVFASRGILFENLSKIIKSETDSGAPQNERLTAIFEIFESVFLTGNNKQYSLAHLYDSCLIVDSLLKGKKAERVHADTVISDFIKYSDSIYDRQREKWECGIKNYFSSLGEEQTAPADPQIIEWLAKLHLLAPGLREYSLDVLAEKMLRDINSEGEDIIGTYTGKITSLGIPGAAELLPELCKSSGELALSYISYYLDGCPSAETVADSAPEFFRDFAGAIPGGEEKLCGIFLEKLENFHLTPRDALVLSAHLSGDNSPAVDKFYGKALSCAFKNINFEKEEAKWFCSLTYSDSEKLTGGCCYFVYAIRHVLNFYGASDRKSVRNGVSLSGAHTEFALSYIRESRTDKTLSPLFYEFNSRLADVIYKMYSDMRINIESHGERLLYDSCAGGGNSSLDYGKLCRVLLMYPGRIPGYIEFVSDLAENSEGEGEKQYEEFLSALEKTLTKTSNQKYAFDIIKSVKARKRDPGGYSEKFMSAIYDWYGKSRNPAEKLLLSAAKKIILRK